MHLHPEKLFFAEKHFSLYTISRKLRGAWEGVKIWQKLFLVFFALIVSQMEYQSTQGGQLFQKKTSFWATLGHMVNDGFLITSIDYSIVCPKKLVLFYWPFKAPLFVIQSFRDQMTCKVFEFLKN